MEIPSDFCEICGELLELPLYGSEIDCRKCGFKIALTDFVSKPIISEIIFQDKKDWLDDYKRSKGLLGQKEDSKKQKATIK
jgi:DNA-directed RNA polymerase subunit RPC12/RpoP